MKRLSLPDINYKLFGILLGASLISSWAVLPYVFSVQANLLSQLPVSLPVLIIAQTVQSLVLFALTIFVGLLLAKKTGFRVPVLESFLHHRPVWPEIKKFFTLSLVAGVFVATAIAILDRLFVIEGLSAVLPPDIPIWQRALAAVYGGVAEEILMRLGVMTLFVWLGVKVFQAKTSRPASTIVWSANILAAILFGLGHLPVTSALTAITPLVIARAILLNGVGGVVFGWLYWKKGLEAAMLSHFMTDITLFIVIPALLSFFV